jgi:ubiquinone/menaquinone biosynthesis C-methylase UbiE
MSETPSAHAPNVEQAVRERYGAAARERETALCCPIEYDPRLLEAIPCEVLERDYGCGDPSRYVRPGDRVLDLGSGGGKVCFIASQIVGSRGSVLGIDMNDEMIGLARRAAPEVARSIGFANVEFRKGRIQDLELDLELVEEWLPEHPVRSATDLSALEDFCEGLRRQRPLVPDASVDVVVSNCVLNLVRESDREQLLQEIHRVVKPGGRIAICDIVADERVPPDLKADPKLWSGCISGAFHESEILRRFEAAGFQGIEIDQWAEQPFRVVRGIEFRSLTLTARKPETSECLEGNHAIVYRGPWKQVQDDDGHVLRRGVRTPVCAKTYRLFSSEPYAAHVVPIPPREMIPENEQEPFDCARTSPRDPGETTGSGYAETRSGNVSCGEDGGCC